MKYIFIFTTLLVSSFLKSQEITSGLIMPDTGFNVCCVCLPSAGLKIYEEPNGNPIGDLTLGSADNNKEVYSLFINVAGIQKELASTNLQMIGYEIMAMIFKDSKDNFVQLNNGYWLYIPEIKAGNLKLTSWMHYLIEKETNWYANKPGLNLREGPSTKFKVIATMKGDLWAIKPTKITKGKWCKVAVIQYRKHPCSGEDNLVIKKLIGWTKLISEEQTPNVWNYAKGC